MYWGCRCCCGRPGRKREEVEVLAQGNNFFLTLLFVLLATTDVTCGAASQAENTTHHLSGLLKHHTVSLCRFARLQRDAPGPSVTFGSLADDISPVSTSCLVSPLT
ncbi:hypothetical protein Hamer_G009675 [Homarus americanus]|uniref:Uncharacterized protein n=1 Tax=Homarus americanus TaxID=6706 RepID=A0A8J5N2X9_HOMAM|nr:hypothetical protein Hamer_G009675 [Homarus americanus]